MKSNEIKVTFQPSGRSVFVLPGTLLLEAAGRAGIVLQTPCGGRGTTEHVDLSLDPEFQMEFGMAMMFPAGDVDSCPDGPDSE